MSRYRKGRICSACTKPIHDENRTGMCRTCYVTASNRDPVMRRKRGKSLGRRLREDGAARERRLGSPPSPTGKPGTRSPCASTRRPP